MELLKKIYTVEGRLNRLRFLKYHVIWLLISTVIAFILDFIGGFVAGKTDSALVTVPTGIWSFVAGVGSIMLTNSPRLKPGDSAIFNQCNFS